MPDFNPAPGQRVVFSARREREITRLLNKQRRDEIGTRGDRNPKLPYGHVVAKNSTGVDLAYGDAAYLSNFTWPEAGGVLYDTRAQGIYTLSRLRPIDGVRNTIGPLAIATEPILNNGFGVVCISGLAVAQTNGTSSVLGYVYPDVTTDPTVARLSAGAWGLAKVVASAGNGWTVIDLTASNLMTMYKLTSGFTPGSGATMLVDGVTAYTGRVYDTYQIAAWQTTNDYGLMRLTGGYFWEVVAPSCVDPAAGPCAGSGPGTGVGGGA